MEYIVQTNNLTKMFGSTEAVSHLNLHLKPGEIYGFLGPNGAGKTTVMKLISNLLKPTEGDIVIFGEKLKKNSYEILKRMGTIIEVPVFYDRMTGRENLEMHCIYMGYHDRKAVDNALEMVNLSAAGNKPVKDYSLGMKQRLGIARAICTKPELLLLDEPVNGLDPIGIKEIRSLFRMLAKEYGMTILVSSHILAEIELIADTIGVINHGRLLKEVSMESIRNEQSEYIEFLVSDTKKASFIIVDKLNISNFKVIDNEQMRIYSFTIPQSEITKVLLDNGVAVNGINRKNSRLEDYFIKILNGGAVNA